MIYLDNNATTMPSAKARDAMLKAVDELWHNPSSMYRAGQAVRRAVELGRASIAKLINAQPKELVFCGCGTCSIHTAMNGAVVTHREVENPNIITTQVEHPAVRYLSKQVGERMGVETRWLPTTPGGRIDASGLEKLIDERTILVSVQWANNETGVIHPVAELGRICREKGVTFHVDGVQWVGKMPTNVGTGNAQDMGPAHDNDCGQWIDMLSFSAHKFHGPKGIGALWIRPGTKFAPSSPGTQELGRRGGTENVPGILGMAAAAEEALEFLSDPRKMQEMAAHRDRFEARVLELVPGSVVNKPADPAHRVWNTTSIAFPRLEAEVLLLMLSERGLCASAGSACSSGSLEPSPVLLAMGIPEELAHGSIRFSLCRDTDPGCLEEAAQMVATCVRQLSGAVPV